MKVITPRHSFSLDYTPKQWIGLCNTFLLLFVTFMFGVVVYNMNSVDQRLVRVLDSSVVAIDLIATDILQSQTTSFWRTVNEDISIYSAFRRDVDGTVLLIGTSKRDVVDVDDLRCLIKYEGEEDDIGIGFVDYRRPSNCSSTIFLYCRAKNTAVPRTVALVSDSSALPKQWVEVKTISAGTEQTSSPTIAVCVKPFTVTVSLKEVAEFVAFYEIIGVSHFYLYNQNARQDVVDFVRELKGLGHSINLLPWNIQDSAPRRCPIDKAEHVLDCSLRAAGRYDYILTVDVQNFVVPMQHLGLPALVDDARKTYKDFSMLRMNFAYFCEVRHSKSKFDDRIELKRKVVRGEMKLSKFNYVLRPDPASSFESNEQLRNGTEVIGTLSGSEVLVHFHYPQCDKAANVDQSAYKYMDLVDDSNILQTFRRTLNGNSNQVTFAST